MKTATVTFHAAHNYGSVLQAHALQQVIMSLGHSNVIIDFRTERQKDLYTVYTRRKGLKYIFKNLSHWLYSNSLQRRFDKFEDFIHKYLILTDKEYGVLEELQSETFNYDCFIAGSDQIWNPIPADFDFAYYLPFVKNGKRISYATSFGQLASKGDKQTINRIKTCLRKFDCISVREQGAFDNVKNLAGTEPKIVLDPTLLLPASYWNTLIDDFPIVKGDYIFFYTLFADKERLNLVKSISKRLKLPIVTSNFSNQYDVINPFIKRYDAGPLDFLNLIKHAKLVVTSSFHGSVFSVILNKPFYSIDGLADARISSLLNNTGLQDRSISIDELSKVDKSSLILDFSKANERILNLREQSIDFIRNSITA